MDLKQADSTLRNAIRPKNLVVVPTRTASALKTPAKPETWMFAQETVPVVRRVLARQ